MASIHQEIVIEAPPERVWDAVRDVGAIHERLAPGFVVDTKLVEGARVVTFGNGMVARELIVDRDDEKRRLAWSVVGGRMTHHTRRCRSSPRGTTHRAVWIADRCRTTGPASRNDRAGARGDEEDARARDDEMADPLPAAPCPPALLRSGS
jgi:hypothetical protein